MKNNRLLKVLSLVLSFSFVLSLWCVPAGALSTATGYYNKMMDSYTALDGTFTLSANSRFFIVSQNEPEETLVEFVKLAASQFAADGKPDSNPLPVIWGGELLSRPGDVLVVLDPSYAEDEYSLTAKSNAVVTASNNRGVLYGLNALLKYIRMENSTCA